MEIAGEVSAIQRRIAQIVGASVDPVDATGVPFNALVAAASKANRPAPVLPQEIARLANASGAAWNVDPALVEAIVANESGFDANATSDAGARGLMQLMPGTATALGVTDAYEPEQNVRGGTRYLRGLLDRFGGNAALAVAAYNAGPGAVEKYGGIPPYAQTRNYVQNVLATYDRYRTRPPR